MPTISINNVDVFTGQNLERKSRQCFQGSPGDILPAQSNAEIQIDGSGCTLIPGLIDSKIDADASSGALAAFASYGVTTVVDSSSANAEIQAMRLATAEDPGLPSYLATGCVVGPDRQELRKMFPFRSIKPVSTPQEAEALVREQLSDREKADYIKIILDQPGLDVQTIAAAVATAHDLGKLALGHASQIEGYKAALVAGIDIVTAVPMDGTLDMETAEAFARKNIGVVPTLSFLKKSLEKNNHPIDKFRHAMDSVRVLHRAGVQICTGTSANKEEGMAVAFGKSLHEEMMLLSDAGLSNLEVLRSATSIPATLFCLPDRGRIAEGLRADLVLLKGNPLEDLGAARIPFKVWVQGIEVDLSNALRED